MRPTRDQLYIEMAKLVAQRTTCLRRAVGCVLVNARGHVLATGYNGVAGGQPHCNEVVFSELVKKSPCPNDFPYHRVQFPVSRTPHACPGSDSLSGTNLDACQAIHAEQNALLQCKDIYDIETCYCTASPCMTCTKLLLNTSCKRIVFLEEYPHANARGLWEGSGRIWGLSK